MAELFRVYEDLGERFHRQGDAEQRDLCLFLAADAALAVAQGGEADRLRRLLLNYNPHHLLRPYNTLTEALRSADVQDYLAGLRQRLPPERAERMLRQQLVPLPQTLEEQFGDPFGSQSLGQAGAAKSAAVSSTLPVPEPAPKPRRRSPYENPDYGPQVPAGPTPSEWNGTWVPLAILAFVLILALAWLGYSLGMPFLSI